MTSDFVFGWRELAAVMLAVVIVATVTWTRYFREREKADAEE